MIKPQNKIWFSMTKLSFITCFKSRGHSQIYLTRILSSQSNFVFSVIIYFIKFFCIFIFFFFSFLMFNIFNLFIESINSENCSLPFYYLVSKLIIKLLLLLMRWLFIRKIFLKFKPCHFFIWNFHIKPIIYVSTLQHIFLQKFHILICHY